MGRRFTSEMLPEPVRAMTLFRRKIDGEELKRKTSPSGVKGSQGNGKV